jgi:hypothetical protein
MSGCWPATRNMGGVLHPEKSTLTGVHQALTSHNLADLMRVRRLDMLQDRCSLTNDLFIGSSPPPAGGA